MPAKSKAQRRLMAIAEHHPDELYAKNAGVADMTHQQLHDFASGSEKGLPKRVKSPKHEKDMTAVSKNATEKSLQADSDARKRQSHSENVEVHAYDFRKQRGRRAPMMMKKGK